MKRITLLAITLLLTSSAVFSQTKAGKTDTTKHITLYTCLIHPDVVRYKPGKCPQCNMELNLSTKEQMKAGVTRQYTCPIHLDVQKHEPRNCPKCGRKLQLSGKEQMKAEVTKVYTCPMHPEIALDKDGKCPKCGKDLIKKKPNK